MSGQPVTQCQNLVLARPVLDLLRVAEISNAGTLHTDLCRVHRLLEQPNHQHCVLDVEVLTHKGVQLIEQAAVAHQVKVALTQLSSEGRQLLIHLGPLIADLPRQISQALVRGLLNAQGGQADNVDMVLIHALNESGIKTGFTGQIAEARHRAGADCRRNRRTLARTRRCRTSRGCRTCRCAC